MIVLKAFFWSSFIFASISLAFFIASSGEIAIMLESEQLRVSLSSSH
jgi:hypothetical protein